MVHKISPFLWYDNQAEEAMNLYCSIFKNSKVLSVQKMGENGPVMSVEFELEGQHVMALNAGPLYKFTEAFSFFVSCEGQAEVDEYWEKLTADGGEPGRCGWLKDKFGLSWQIIPKQLGELMGDPDPEKSKRVVDVMLKMNKLEVSELEKAHRGE